VLRKLYPAGAAALTALMLFAPAASAQALTPKQIHRAQVRLAKLHFEAAAADGVVGPMTARGMCGFELISSLHAHLGPMGRMAYRKLMRTKRLRRAAHPESSYLSVSLRCQVLYEVRNHHYVRIIPASTGRAGTDALGRPSFATRNGKWSIFSRVDGWQESNEFSGGWMWRPMYFSGGEAIHGEPSGSVLPYYASHGCVRVFEGDQNALWARSHIGTVVYVG
jgi:lipoprotein-anchoring transpeptidase ErfK/SrfK